MEVPAATGQIVIFYRYCEPDAKLEQNPRAQQCVCGFPLNLFSRYQVKECGFAGQEAAVVPSASTSAWTVRGLYGAYTYFRDQPSITFSLLFREGLTLPRLQECKEFPDTDVSLQLVNRPRLERAINAGHPLCIPLRIGWEWRRVRACLQCRSSEVLLCEVFPCPTVHTTAQGYKKWQEWLAANAGQKHHVWVPVQWESWLVALARENGQSQTRNPALTRVTECSWHCIMNGSCWIQLLQLTRVRWKRSDERGFHWEMSSSSYPFIRINILQK